MNKVLVLCQRKTGRINMQTLENVSKQINPAIEEVVSDIIKEPCTFEYMSPGLVEVDGTADYRFKLDGKEEAQQFILNNHKG